MLTEKQKQGKRNKASGRNFELKVRKDLELKRWIVLKNPNNVIDQQFIQGKSKYNPFTKRLMMNSGGFPDFICFKELLTESQNENHEYVLGYEIIGVECKGGDEKHKYLDKEEKEKCKWLLKNVFQKILIANKIKKGRKVIIKYKEIKL